MKWRRISDFVRKEKEGTELLPKRTPKEGDIFSGALFSKITLTRFALQKKMFCGCHRGHGVNFSD